MAGIGQMVAPQPNMVQQGVAPQTPEEHASLSQRWQQFFTNPMVSAGLAQFGTSLLANVGSRAPFAARVGLAGNDALRAVGGAAKFQADQQSEQARQQAEQERLRQGRQGLEQSASDAATGRELQKQGIGLQERQLQQSSEQSAKELALREKELQSNDAYRKLQIGLQQEQLHTSVLGLQTPRGRALLALQKNIQDSQQLDPELDVGKAVTDGMAIIDQMFPEASSAVAPAAGGGAPAGPAMSAAPTGSAPAAPSGGEPTPDNPLPGALPFDQAATYLKSNPTSENRANFDIVYGKGQADKVLGPAK